MTVDLVLNPLLPWPAVVVAVIVALLLLLVLIIRRGRGWTLRLLGLAILVMAILNPSVLREHRVPQPDLALVVVDESPSQRVGDRPQQVETIVKSLERGISRFAGVETRIVRAAGKNQGEDGTRLFKAIKTALADETRERLAAIIVISDGQVHDVPAEGGEAPTAGPLHVVLTGKPDETDRRLVVDSAPAYGLVGSTAHIHLRILDDRPDGKGAGTASAMLNVRVDGRETTAIRVGVGQPQTHGIVLQHAGPTILELEAEALPGELSAVNNRALVTINGVRDRLNVLLVSGQPHVGERIWRNMLKSDPAVDLVHFTILRSPDKEDLATIEELSLIAFPVRELFEERLYDFDLVIFDRYLLRGVLPFRYLDEVVTYVQKGGALLLAVGPEFAGPLSLFHSPMGQVLPAVPTGRVIEQAYRPTLTAIGRRHPLTSALPGEMPMGAAEVTQSDNDEPAWGQWYRQIEADVRSGAVLFAGAGEHPLLVVDRVGEGRIAELLSDHLWLWARGHDGGGPHAELIRRLVHWLMKEPELEEERLTATMDEGRLLIERRSLDSATTEVTVTTPAGVQRRIPVEQGNDGIGRAEMPAEDTGLYRIDDGTRTALAAGGRVNHGEFADLTATEARLRPIVGGSGGGLFWAANGIPDIRRVKPGHRAAGDDWIGLRRNDHYTVTGQNEAPVIPPLLLLALALAAFAGAWWRESH